MPNGMPSRYQATKNAIQTTRTTAAIGIVKEARVPGILAVSVDVMLAEPRRYWLDRDLTSGLGEFHAPTLL